MKKKLLLKLNKMKKKNKNSKLDLEITSDDSNDETTIGDITGLKEKKSKKIVSKIDKSKSKSKK